MKIIINVSNLYFGGGVQVALSFLNEIKYFNSNNIFHIFLSNEIDKQLDTSSFRRNFLFYVIKTSPSSLKTRYKVVKELNDLENKINPNIVFTLFGPSYWKPKTLHLMGFADGWVYNPYSIAYKRLNLFKKFKLKLLSIYKKYYLKRDADCFVLETEDAKEKLSKVLYIEKDKFFVVGNTYSSIYNDSKYLEKSNKSYIFLAKKKKEEYRLLYISHNHPNKNLMIINKVLPLLKNYNIKFVLTIDEKSYSELFNDKKNIINVGPIPLECCPSLYSQCDALFAPTLLETFSAAYPEAMKMEIPILTSNYTFATDICKDAALYFNPIDEYDISNKIIQLVNDKELQQKLIMNGSLQLKQFETSKSRAQKYINLCEKLYNSNLKEINE